MAGHVRTYVARIVSWMGVHDLGSRHRVGTSPALRFNVRFPAALASKLVWLQELNDLTKEADPDNTGRIQYDGFIKVRTVQSNSVWAHT